MKYCVDTDIIIRLFRNDGKVIAKFNALTSDDGLFTTWISVYEFYKGMYLSKVDQEPFLERFLTRVKALPESQESAKIGGKIYVDLRKKNKLIPETDIIIAAIAIVNDCTLVSCNEQHFKRITGLKFENWLK